MPDPATSVRLVIVNHESGDFLGDLLRSIDDALRAESGLRATTLVVDNASSDLSFEACGCSALPVVLKRMHSNVGFGTAANLGLQDATEPWLFVMNSDLRLARDFFARFASLQSRLPADVGIVGPALLEEDLGCQPSVGGFPTMLGTLAGLFRPRRRRKYLPLWRHRRGAVPWVTGACLAIRRECWEALGGFDPRFLLYYEDVDLCRRARSAGYRVLYESELRVIHREPISRREVPPHLVPVIRYSQLLYFRLHRPDCDFRLLAALTRAWAAWNAWKKRRGWSDGGVDWALIRELPERVLRGEPSPSLSN